MADVNLWANADHAIEYLERRSSIPRRSEAYEVLFEILPAQVDRVLDLGTGDGFTLELVLDARPAATGVAVDFQDEMLDRARERFASTPTVDVVRHDLDAPLPDLGDFDVVVSSFAIHHLVPDRQRTLYGEVFDRLRPGRLVRQPRARRVHDRPPARRVPRRDRRQPRPGRPVQQARGGCDPFGLVGRFGLRRRGMPLEVAGTGRCYRYQALTPRRQPPP